MTCSIAMVNYQQILEVCLEIIHSCVPLRFHSCRMLRWLMSGFHSAVSTFQEDLPEPATDSLFIQIWDPQNPQPFISCLYWLILLAPWKKSHGNPMVDIGSLLATSNSPLLGSNQLGSSIVTSPISGVVLWRWHWLGSQPNTLDSNQTSERFLWVNMVKLSWENNGACYGDCLWEYVMGYANHLVRFWVCLKIRYRSQKGNFTAESDY